LIGFGLLGVAALVAVLALWRFGVAAGNLRLLWLALCILMVVLAGVVAWLLHGLTTMHYILDEHCLTIVWMRERRLIPLTDIIDAEYDPHVPVPSGGWEPLWPGYYVSRRRLPTGLWRVWATLSPRQRVRVRTTHGNVAISPQRPIRFIVELDRLRAGAAPAWEPEVELGPTRGSASLPQHTPPFGWPGIDREPEYEPSRTEARRPLPPDDQWEPEPVATEHPEPSSAAGSSIVSYLYHTLFRKQLLGDRVASNFVAAGVILPLLMAAYLYSQYEGVPSVVPIHWDALGEVDRVVNPRALWRLPLMAVLILLANTFLAMLLTAVDRFLARLLVAAIPIAQIVTFVALVRAVR
jgi:hypothetical protein